MVQTDITIGKNNVKGAALELLNKSSFVKSKNSNAELEPESGFSTKEKEM